MVEKITLQSNSSTEDYKAHMEKVDKATKIHQGVSARLFEDLNKFRSRLSKDLIIAFETTLDEIKKVDTVKEAQDVLKALFDKVYTTAEELDSTSSEKDKLLEVAQEIADLKNQKTLEDIIENTAIRY